MKTSSALEALTKAKHEPDVVEIPGRLTLSIEGTGAPGGERFQRSIAALYGIAYTLKFTRKKRGVEMGLGPLEGDWWIGGRPPDPDTPKDSWRWRLRITVPSDMTAHEVEEAISAATSKRGGKLEGSVEAGRVSLRKEPRHRYGRILHVGPYADEPRSFDRLQVLLDQRKLRREPWHTEVYLSDPRRTAPQKVKTALLVRLRG